MAQHIDVLSKDPKSSTVVTFTRARHSHYMPVDAGTRDPELRTKLQADEKNKMLNVIFHEGEYYFTHPFADKKLKRDPD